MDKSFARTTTEEDEPPEETAEEEEVLRRIAEAAYRLRRAQLRLLSPTTSEEALEAAREEARALRMLDRALCELPSAQGRGGRRPLALP